MYPHRQPPDSPRHAVLTTIASDSHTWNLLFLQLLLEEQGWEITSLGACVPVGVLLEEAMARTPDLVVVSTVNGHGVEEAPGLARAVRAVPALAEVPLVVGGKLDTSGTTAADVHASLLDAGFDAVLTGANAVPKLLALLDALPEHRHGRSHADAVR